ncbi:MAG: RNA-binding S4 domain-containing protein [Verrucomicrobiae bacterium]|nr:RNA-binding S4 domain-containing protein [Verrucomicrobiae bacterium]
MSNGLNQSSEVRLDKWLWATRVFKTRSQAAAACTAGHVKLNGTSLKPAHSVHVGEIFTVKVGDLTRTVRVVGLISQRVGPKLVRNYLEDLTPQAEYERVRTLKQQAPVYRPKGRGRPTKKERRLLQLMGFIEPPM